MRSPGLDIRPLRELTGAAMFNEVFIDEVFVPDDCVIGEVNGGWALARMTLANERVSMSSGSTFGIGVESLLRLAQRRGPSDVDRPSPCSSGQLLAEAQSLGLMTHRSTLRGPGRHRSRTPSQPAQAARRRARAAGPGAGAGHARTRGCDRWRDSAQRWTQGFLATRCLTVAGGTSEVQRNVIGERLLGLPRDPEPARGLGRLPDRTGAGILVFKNWPNYRSYAISPRRNIGYRR